MPLAGFAGRLYGKHAGAAPRILLLHGFTGDARDWGLWPEHAPAALAIDLPGHGASPDPTGGFADEIGRLLAALPPSIERLVGYSLGGRIALSLIAAAPARLRSATILSAHPGLDNAQQRRERRRDDQHWIGLLQTQGINAFVDAWERQPLFATQAGLPAAVLHAQRQRRLAQRAEGLARNLACFGLAEMPATWTALKHWPGHLHWLAGALDAKFVAIAKQMNNMRPRTHVQIVPDAGHNLLLEAPKIVQRCHAH